MHPRTFSGIGILCLALLIAGLHFLANLYYLYWLWWWFDILMHFLGGAFIGASVLWLVRYEVPVMWRRFVPRFLVAFLVVVCVGVLWEVFERVTGMYASINYELDTALDLITNVSGMLSAYLIAFRYGK